MALIERDVVLTSKQDGQDTLDMPITRLGNVEGDAAIKETIGANDYIALVDGDDGDEMKKISAGKLATKEDTKLYGICGTSSKVAAKVVTLPSFTLSEGKTIQVKFTFNNTAGNPTLNVNNTGAKPIHVSNGVPISDGMWVGGEVVTFTYDGSAWIAIGKLDAVADEFGLVKITDNPNPEITDSKTALSVVGSRAISNRIDALTQNVVIKSQMGANNGVAVLDANGQLETYQLPIGKIMQTYVVEEDQTSTEQAKTGTTDGMFVLQEGVRIAFFARHTAFPSTSNGNFTLSVNGFEALPVRESDGKNPGREFASFQWPLYLTYSESDNAWIMDVCRATSDYFGLVQKQNTLSRDNQQVTTGLAVSKAIDEVVAKFTSGTEDLVAGTSELADGTFYFVYE